MAKHTHNSAQASPSAPAKIGSLRITPIAGFCGAMIEGVDLSQSVSEDLFAHLHQALLDYKVIVFPEQNISPAQHIAFARLFGAPQKDEFVSAHDQHPELIELLKEADDEGHNFGGSWHTDSTYLECPPMGVVLHGIEIPPYGGDTIWVNMQMVYEALSSGMRDLLDGMQAEHIAYGPREKLKVRKGDYSISFHNENERRIAVTHPVIRTHPVSGDKALFINPAYTYRFDEMSEEESLPLVNYLCQFAITNPSFQCRFRWQAGSVAVWDNRNSMHRALNDYQGFRRLMHRYTVTGDRPQ